jgi:adenine-specific DNA-methyltransferase
VKEPLFEYLSTNISHQIIKGDSLSVLKKTEDNRFDLIVTSPPYNIGKSYETKTSIEEYLLIETYA